MRTEAACRNARLLVPAAVLCLAWAFPSLSGCGVSKSKHELALSEREAWRVQAEQCETKRKELEQKHQEMVSSFRQFEQNHQDLLDRLAALHADNEELSKTVRLLQEQQKAQKREAQEAGQTYRDFLGSLSAEVSQGRIRIDQSEKGLRLNLVDKILFDSGSADLSPKGEQLLEKVGFVLKDIRDRRILVEGHTDNVPIRHGPRSCFRSNWELSSARAASVARFLEEKAGVDPRLLSATGYSSHRPAFDNSTPEGRQANRRIEILLLPLSPAEIQSLYGRGDIPQPPTGPSSPVSPSGQ